MKVGIRFSDNDFVLSIRMFFELYIIPNFIERERGHYITHLTSSQIVEMFNLYVPFCHKYMSEHIMPHWYDSNYDINHYKDYLQITESNIYWDDKTDEYIPAWNSQGSEFTYTDGKTVNPNG